jgi:hypothetical protein
MAVNAPENKRQLDGCRRFMKEIVEYDEELEKSFPPPWWDRFKE